MSCFIVPLVQAVATTAYRKAHVKPFKSVLGKEIPSLEKMLWGGTVMLIVDHVINGELTWRFPFFTALNEAGGLGTMLHEMLTVGLPISLVLTAVWSVYAFLRRYRGLSVSNS